MELRVEELRPETEGEANSGSRKTSEYRNKAKASSEEAARLSVEIAARLQEFTALNAQANADATSIKQHVQAFADEIQNLTRLNADATQTRERIESVLSEAEEAQEALSAKSGELDEIGKLVAKSQEVQKKVELQLKNSAEVADSIRELSTEIFGYEEESENGDTTKVDGLKDKLEKTYNDLTKRANTLGEQIGQVSKETAAQLTTLLSEWSERHTALNKRIESLLPRALTAGLSHAYSTKKEDELKEGRRVMRAFYAAIFGLVVVSLIPFGVALHAVLTGIPIHDAIARMPRLVFAILPLYVPVIWVAYSANRRSNLSKRLVEEYSHKEVLAKTYEGLAKQVSELPSDISLELRTKLLYIILEISAENPGKLISDYNKSDHPLMDALDKSVQLATAVEKLSRIPGFSKIAVQMKEKADRVLEEKNTKAVAGLNSLPNQKEE